MERMPCGLCVASSLREDPFFLYAGVGGGGKVCMPVFPGTVMEGEVMPWCECACLPEKKTGPGKIPGPARCMLSLSP